MRNHFSLAILLLAMLSGLYAFDYAQNSQFGIEKSITGFSVDWWPFGSEDDKWDDYTTTNYDYDPNLYFSCILIHVSRSTFHAPTAAAPQ